MKNAVGTTLLSGILLTFAILIIPLAGCSSPSDTSAPPPPPAWTPIPTQTATGQPPNVLAPVLSKLISDYESKKLTGLQYEAKLDALIGRQDVWEGKVIDVIPYNHVTLSIEPDICFLCEVQVRNIPLDKSMQLQRDDLIRIRGRFTSYQRGGRFWEYLTIIIDFRERDPGQNG